MNAENRRFMLLAAGALVVLGIAGCDILEQPGIDSSDEEASITGEGELSGQAAGEKEQPAESGEPAGTCNAGCEALLEKLNQDGLTDAQYMEMKKQYLECTGQADQEPDPAKAECYAAYEKLKMELASLEAGSLEYDVVLKQLGEMNCDGATPEETNFKEKEFNKEEPVFEPGDAADQPSAHPECDALLEKLDQDGLTDAQYAELKQLYAQCTSEGSNTQPQKPLSLCDQIKMKLGYVEEGSPEFADLTQLLESSNCVVSEK